MWRLLLSNAVAQKAGGWDVNTVVQRADWNFNRERVREIRAMRDRGTWREREDECSESLKITCGRKCISAIFFLCFFPSPSASCFSSVVGERNAHQDVWNRAKLKRKLRLKNVCSGYSTIVKSNRRLAAVFFGNFRLNKQIDVDNNAESNEPDRPYEVCVFCKS